MSDKDVDAQFADIIAHWNDVLSLPESASAESGPTESASAGSASAGSAPTESTSAESASAEPTSTESASAESAPTQPAPTQPEDLPGYAARHGEARSTPVRRPGVNPPLEPPAERGFVWRGPETGAVPGHAAGHDPAELTDHIGLDDEDHFQPLPTAPLPPQEDLNFWGIIVGLVAGPLLLLWLVLFRPAVSGWWTLGALGLTVGGFVLLVLRQPSTRDHDDPDNGARI